MKVSEVEALLALRLLPGIGDLGATRLLRGAGSARRAWSDPDAVARAGRSETRRALARPESWVIRARSILRRCEGAGIAVVGFLDDAYPETLRHLHDPPPILFMKGRTKVLSRPLVAMVGSRKATATGRRTARRMARELSSRGMGVVSGMALGIDGAAHRGALEGKGSTVAVLGRGPDRAYPVANADLFRAVGRDGLLLSEFPPGERARPHNFPRRNRIIAALAWGVVVVEAGERSGALITVDHALDLGREVMAVPGSVEWEQSRGTHALIRSLGCIVTSSRDILERVPWASLGMPEGGEGMGELDPAPRLRLEGPTESMEERLDELVGIEPLPLEEILARSGLPASRALSTLTRLEIEGRLRREPEGWVRVEC